MEEHRGCVGRASRAAAQRFRGWIQGQRALYDAMQQERPGSPPIGMSAAHGEAAIRLAEVSDRMGTGPWRE